MYLCKKVCKPCLLNVEDPLARWGAGKVSLRHQLVAGTTLVLLLDQLVLVSAQLEQLVLMFCTSGCMGNIKV
jgi:hypothetical protein